MPVPRLPLRWRVAALAVLVVSAWSSAVGYGQPLPVGNVDSGADAPVTVPLDGREGRDLLLRDFRPRSMLRVPANPRPRAKFPVVDVHTHLRFKIHRGAEELDEYVGLMDDQNIALSISLDGQLGAALEDHRQFLWNKHPTRFLFFANVDWKGTGDKADVTSWDCHRPGFARRIASRLIEAQRRGAVGLKIFKRLGLGYQNPDGSLVAIDDPRWDPIWAACGRLGLPVLIHTADPVAFFEPLDAHNERWDELRRHPEWSFAADKYPSHAELVAARNRVIARHPQTQFIGAHVANHPENLAVVADWLDRYPNLCVEIAARIAELGRQPRTARKFFLKYADRILFGTDGPRSAARTAAHWRFLETADEYFPYGDEPFPTQGLWNIYGLDLPDDVLRKIYHQNAARLIPGVQEKLAPFLE